MDSCLDSRMQKYSEEVVVDHGDSSQELEGESSPVSNLWPEREDIPFYEPYSVNIQDRYIEKEQLGEGAFGTVVRGICRFTGEEVALKIIPGRGNCNGDVYSVPKPAFREMAALKHLQHPNVVRLRNVFPRANAVVLVMDFCWTDLSSVLEAEAVPIPEGESKQFIHDLLSALDAIHALGIMHRDLKPGNLLLDSSCRLKLADFGLARTILRGRAQRTATPPTNRDADADNRRGEEGAAVRHRRKAQYSHQVATRWYRAPELLFGARQYDTAVDMWGVGCVAAELILNEPIFPGRSDIDQIARVLRVVGSVTAENWPDASSLPDFKKIFFPNFVPKPLPTVFPNTSPCFITLLEQMLVLDPKRRVTAETALRHACFSQDPLPCPPDVQRISRSLDNWLKTKPEREMKWQEDMLKEMNKKHSRVESNNSMTCGDGEDMIVW